MRARVPQGRRIGQKSEGVRPKEGKERASVHHSLLSFSLLWHPGQPAPEVQRSAAMQKHPRSCPLGCSQHKDCLPKSLICSTCVQVCLPRQPPQPPHAHTLNTTSSLPPHPAAEGDVFPQAITTVTCYVFAHSTKCLRAGHLGKPNVGKNNPPTGQLLPFGSGLRKSCRSALSQRKVKKSMWGWCAVL